MTEWVFAVLLVYSAEFYGGGTLQAEIRSSSEQLCRGARHQAILMMGGTREMVALPFVEFKGNRITACEPRER